MIKEKPFNWLGYIDLAEDILKQISPKDMIDDQKVATKARCGISRAYYGIFHTVQKYLTDVDIQPDTTREGSHQAVVNACLGCKDNKILLKIGEDLDRLRKKRKQADYDDIYFTNEGRSCGRFYEELAFVIVTADEMIENIKTLRKNMNR